MSTMDRRELLKWAGVSWVAWQLPRPLAAAAAEADRTPRILTIEQWRDVDAMTALILPPSSGRPGAAEAGCVNFIDKSLAHEDAAARQKYTVSLEALNRVCRQRFDVAFHALSPSVQQTVMRAIEDGAIEPWPVSPRQQDFFETLRTHTVIGFLADPKYGGNRHYRGWRAMGYPGPIHRMGGASDAQVRGEQPLVPIWQRSDER